MLRSPRYFRPTYRQSLTHLLPVYYPVLEAFANANPSHRPFHPQNRGTAVPTGRCAAIAGRGARTAIAHGGNAPFVRGQQLYCRRALAGWYHLRARHADAGVSGAALRMDGCWYAHTRGLIPTVVLKTGNLVVGAVQYLPCATVCTGR